jgi:hypothetical protein
MPFSCRKNFFMIKYYSQEQGANNATDKQQPKQT